MGFHDVRLTNATTHTSLSQPARNLKASETSAPQAEAAPPAQASQPAVKGLKAPESGRASSQLSFVEGQANKQLQQFKQALSGSELNQPFKRQLLEQGGITRAQAREAYQTVISAGPPGPQKKNQDAGLAEVFYKLSQGDGSERVSLEDMAALSGELRGQKQALRQLKAVLGGSSIPEPLGQKILVGEALTPAEIRQIHQQTQAQAQAYDARVMELFGQLSNQKLSLSPAELKARLSQLGT